ncbi:MAG: patatin-like phospholipase family protein [Oligoflexia bacterium]|nr:patatin-like phospholipase family protein [Oligoflexia bacterium]
MISQKIGLVMTGGGARAAYQAGAVRAISDILGKDEPNPFQVITGSSAGAINGAFLASRGHNFAEATQILWDIWSELRLEDIFRTDTFSFVRQGAQWWRDLSIGGLLGSSRVTYLLDAAPLRRFLSDKIDFANLKEEIRIGRLRGVAVSATNYRTGSTVTFYDGVPEIEPWQRTSRIGLRTELRLSHILASASIPVFFEPVPLEDTFYGDGCMRLGTPLSPAIHLGAERVIAVGVRYFRPEQTVLEMNRKLKMKFITLADIAGVILNSVFLDSLDADLERMERINQTLSLLSEEAIRRHPQKLRSIPVLALRPSEDLGILASRQMKSFPWIFRHLMRGIGASHNQGLDLMSYLAFDRTYTRQLLDLGYADTWAIRDEVREFFTAPARDLAVPLVSTA